jgi:hypothetical protein
MWNLPGLIAVAHKEQTGTDVQAVEICKFPLMLSACEDIYRRVHVFNGEI